MSTIHTGTFEIIAARDGGFDVYDRDMFNHWDGPKGLVTLAEAETWAERAHAFKRGRTFEGVAEWVERRGVMMPS